MLSRRTGATPVLASSADCLQTPSPVRRHPRAFENSPALGEAETLAALHLRPSLSSAPGPSTAAFGSWDGGSEPDLRPTRQRIRRAGSGMPRIDRADLPRQWAGGDGLFAGRPGAGDQPGGRAWRPDHQHQRRAARGERRGRSDPQRRDPAMRRAWCADRRRGRQRRLCVPPRPRGLPLVLAVGAMDSTGRPIAASNWARPIAATVSWPWARTFQLPLPAAASRCAPGPAGRRPWCRPPPLCC